MSKLSDATFRYYRSFGIASPPTRRGQEEGRVRRELKQPNLITVYPPSLSSDLFLSDFSSYLEILAASTLKVMIVGDFNIHIDDPTYNYVGRNFLSRCVLLTMVAVDRKDTLDLVITLLSDKLLSDSAVSDYLTDHAATHCLNCPDETPIPSSTEDC